MSSSDSDEPKRPAATAAAKPAASKPAAKRKESDASSSEHETKETKPAVKQDKTKYESESEESEDDGNRVVKSAKDKALDAVGKSAKELIKLCPGDDWVAIRESFESLNKVLEKSQRALNNVVPDSYLEAMLILSRRVETINQDKALQKKLSSARYKAWSVINTRIAKHLEKYRPAMAAYEERKLQSATEAPAASSTSSESSSSGSSSESSSSSSGDDSSSESSSSGAEESDAGTSSSEEEASSEFEESSSSSSEEDEPGRAQLVGRAKWVKRVAVEVTRKKDAGDNAAIAAAEEERKKARQRELEEKRLLQEQIEKERKSREALVVLTARDVERLLAATVNKLWRREANRRELTEQLRQHASRAVAFGPRILLPTMMHLISSQFDNRTIDEHMPIDRWRAAVADVTFTVKLLEKNPGLRLVPLATDDQLDVTAGVTESVEDILNEAANRPPGFKPEPMPEIKEGPIKVVGDIAVFALRLAAEHTKALKNVPPHSHEFVDFLSEEGTLLDLLELVQAHLVRVEDMAPAAKVALARVELLCYKHENIAAPTRRAHFERLHVGRATHPACLHPGDAGDDTNACLHPAARQVAVPAPPFDVAKELDALTRFVYMHGDDVAQVRAMLSHIYHHALHDRFFVARDLLLMSRLQDVIGQAEPDSQILFNRVMVQLGLCAFRLGRIADAHNCLVDICSTGRMTEHLAQRKAFRNKFQERDIERENAERRRLVPFHLHINVDLVESCHMLSAVLLEAAVPEGGEIVSRAFRRMLSNAERQMFTGPPENVKEHILACYEALRVGDWERATSLVVGLSVWELMPNPAAVKDMLRGKIKSESLRTYLLANARHYESLSLGLLREMFALDDKEVKRVVARMILSRELAASWNGDNLVMLLAVPSSLQSLSVQFSDKLRKLVESNELSLDRLTGGGGREQDSRGNARGGGGRGRGGFRREWVDDGDRRQGGGGGRGGGMMNVIARGYRPDRSSRR